MAMVYATATEILNHADHFSVFLCFLSVAGAG